MKVAILSDIHGNVYALEAMLKVARKEKVEKLLILGDIVGYYYHPQKIIELLSDWDHHLIKGNHEEILANIVSGKVQESEIRLKYGSGHRIALEQLSTEQLQMLLNAPRQMLLEYNGTKILICHSSPWELDLYLYPDTKREILDKSEQFEADLILVGHSHYPFIYKTSKNMLVNCGSIGQSRNSGGHASWALFNTNNGVVQLRSTPYNVDQLLEEIEEHDPGMTYLRKVLLRTEDE